MKTRKSALLMLAPLPLAIAMALNPTLAAADFEFDQLCGQTLTENLKVENHTDTICGQCTITVADGVKLTIIDSDLTFSQSGYNAVRFQGEGGASLAVKGTNFSLSGQISFYFPDGDLTVKDNWFHANSGVPHVDLSTRYGHLTVKDNLFSMSSSTTYMVVGTSGGDLDFKDNDLSFNENSLSIHTGYGGELKMTGNVMTGMASSIWVSEGWGNVGVVDNTLSTNYGLSVSADGGDISIVRNDIDIDPYDQGDRRLWVDSDGGDIAVVDNDFGSYLTGADVHIDASPGGWCRTNRNTPELFCN